jgi:hypothetical protein
VLGVFMSRLRLRLDRVALDPVRAHRIARVILAHVSATNPSLIAAASELVEGLDTIQYEVNKGSRSVYLFGKTYALTVPQSRCLDVLIPRYKRKQPWVSTSFLETNCCDPEEEGSQSFRDMWREHELMKDGILTHGPRKGTVGIQPPEEKAKPRTKTPA